MIIGVSRGATEIGPSIGRGHPTRGVGSGLHPFP